MNIENAKNKRSNPSSVNDGDFVKLWLRKVSTRTRDSKIHIYHSLQSSWPQRWYRWDHINCGCLNMVTDIAYITSQDTHTLMETHQGTSAKIGITIRKLGSQFMISYSWKPCLKKFQSYFKTYRMPNRRRLLQQNGAVSFVQNVAPFTPKLEAGSITRYFLKFRCAVRPTFVYIGNSSPLRFLRSEWAEVELGGNSDHERSWKDFGEEVRGR